MKMLNTGLIAVGFSTTVEKLQRIILANYTVYHQIKVESLTGKLKSKELKKQMRNMPQELCK